MLPSVAWAVVAKGPQLWQRSWSNLNNLLPPAGSHGTRAARHKSLDWLHGTSGMQCDRM